MHALLDFLSVFAGLRSGRWLGLIVLGGIGAWYGGTVVFDRIDFGAAAAKIEAALSAPPPGWSKPQFERDYEGGGLGVVIARYSKDGAAMTVRVRTVTYVLPPTRQEFLERARKLPNAEAHVEQAGGQTVFLTIIPVYPIANVYLRSRVIVQAMVTNAGGRTGPGEVRALILAFMEKIDYAAIVRAVE